MELRWKKGFGLVVATWGLRGGEGMMRRLCFARGGRGLVRDLLSGFSSCAPLSAHRRSFLDCFACLLSFFRFSGIGQK